MLQEPLTLDGVRASHGVIAHSKTGEFYISDASNGFVLKTVKERGGITAEDSSTLHAC